VDLAGPESVPPGIGIRAREVSFVYPGGVVALRGVDLDVPEGDFAVLVGPSGSGKSTLLRTLNGLVRPAAGSVVVDGKDVATATASELRELRQGIAFIPQHFNLVERSSVLTNTLAGRLAHVGLVPGLLGRFPPESRELALRTLDRIGLGDKAGRRVDSLSGGEQQRVAIARALAQQPRMIVADEPVSNLDHGLARRILEIFETINREDGVTVVVALHDLRLAKTFANRIVVLHRGRVAYSGGRDERTLEQLGELTERAVQA
jgi:phosphonate transport system ATP-binding protein